MTRAGLLASQLTARYFAETSTVAWMHKHTYLMTTDTRFSPANTKAQYQFILSTHLLKIHLLMLFSFWSVSHFPPKFPDLNTAFVTVFLISATWYNWPQAPCFHYGMCVYRGDRGSTVVRVLRYKSKGRWFDPSWCHWHKILPIALRPWGRLSF